MDDDEHLCVLANSTVCKLFCHRISLLTDEYSSNDGKSAKNGKWLVYILLKCSSFINLIFVMNREQTRQTKEGLNKIKLPFSGFR